MLGRVDNSFWDQPCRKAGLFLLFFPPAVVTKSRGQITIQLTDAHSKDISGRFYERQQTGNSRIRKRRDRQVHYLRQSFGSPCRKRKKGASDRLRPQARFHEASHGRPHASHGARILKGYSFRDDGYKRSAGKRIYGRWLHRSGRP